MTNVVIELIRASSAANSTYKFGVTHPNDVVEVVDALNIILPKLLDDAIALYLKVRIYTETVNKEPKPL